jgi:hypothetical protein
MNIDVLRVIFNIVVTIGLCIVWYVAKENSDEIKRIEDIANKADLTNSVNFSKLDSLDHHLVELTLREAKLKQQIAKLEKKVKKLEKELKQ